MQQDFRNTVLTALRDNGTIFPVRSEPVMSANSNLLFPERRILINELLNQPIGLVSQSYKVVDNEHVFNTFCDSIERTGLNTDDVQIFAATAQHGARSLVKFRFPHEKVSLGFDNSDVSCEIAVLNSFDGSTRYVTRVGAFRMACLNGQLLGNLVGNYSQYHTASLNVEAGAKQLLNMLEAYKRAPEYWGKMNRIIITDNDAHELIKLYFQLPEDTDVLTFTRSSVVPHMVKAWKGYKKQMGSTLYSFYNALTDFVSHKQYKKETEATGRVFNEKRLQKFLTTNSTFKQAELA